MRDVPPIKRRINSDFRESVAYVVARGFKNSLRQIRKEVRERGAPERRVISLNPEGSARGRVLFSYIITGFFLEPGSPIPKSHTNIWQSLKMAETFVELGFEVDVIHYTNTRFLPREDYSFFVDVRHNMERLSPYLNRSCIKIIHLDTAHILFHNASEAKRLLQLKDRRGTTLLPKRFEMPNLGIEHADYATTGGNDFTIDTFTYANKKIFRLPSPCGIMFDRPRKKWDKCRTQFLWFSSSGFVHKGLDLALEAFSEMPECQLTVCAPMEKDKDFVREYSKELYETPNIKTVGWVDIDSKKFREITESCVGMLHLSCSEGGAPSVKVCMHAGLIPIVSYESGVDVHDFGFMLKDCSITNVKMVVKQVSSLSQNEIEEKAHRAWEFASSIHTRENFAKEYRNVILDIIEDIQNNRSKSGISTVL